MKAQQEDVVDKPTSSEKETGSGGATKLKRVDDDVVDFQMDDVVSKLQHKNLSTKVDVKGAIGREGDVIVLRPRHRRVSMIITEGGESTNDVARKRARTRSEDISEEDYEKENEEMVEYPRLMVSVYRSQVQGYLLPSYTASEVQAKVPSRMLVTVVKELRDERARSSTATTTATTTENTTTTRPDIGTDASAMLKEDDISPPTHTPAPPSSSSTTSFPSPIRRRYVPERTLPPSKDEFSIQSFLEKYAAKTVDKHPPRLATSFKNEEEADIR